MPPTAKQGRAASKALRKQTRLRPSISRSRPKRLGVGESYYVRPTSTPTGRRNVRREQAQEAGQARKAARAESRRQPLAINLPPSSKLSASRMGVLPSKAGPSARRERRRLARSQRQLERSVEPARERAIVRGLTRPQAARDNSPAEIRRYNREKTVYGRGEQARAMLQLPKGDSQLDRLKDVPSHIVRESSIQHINESIKKIDRQIAKTPIIDYQKQPSMSAQAVAAHNLKVQDLQNARAQLQTQRSSLKTRRFIAGEKKLSKALQSDQYTPKQRNRLRQTKGRLRKQELAARERTKGLKGTAEKFKQQAKDTRGLAADTGGGGFGFKQKTEAFVESIPGSVLESAKGVAGTAEQTVKNIPFAVKHGGVGLQTIPLATAKTAKEHPAQTALTAATVLPIEDVAFAGGRVTLGALGLAGRAASRRASRTLIGRALAGGKGLAERAGARTAAKKEAERVLAKPLTKGGKGVPLARGEAAVPSKPLVKKAEAEAQYIGGKEIPAIKGGAATTSAKTVLKGEKTVPTKAIDKQVEKINNYEATMRSRFEVRPTANPRGKGGMVVKRKQLYAELDNMVAKQVAGSDRFLKAPTVNAYKAAKKTITGVPVVYNKYKYPIWVIGSATAAGAGYDLTVKKGREITKVYHDTRDLMAGFPYAIYVSGKAGAKALTGDTTELEQLWKNIKNTDPVALAVQGRFDEALKSAEARPVTAALSVIGWSSLAGRVPGVGARAIGGISGYVPVVSREGLTNELAGVGTLKGIGRRIGHVGTQVRAPIDITEGGALINRRYSPNLGIKAVQHYAEKLGNKKLSEDQLIARQQLAGVKDIQNDMAMFDLSSRVSVGNAEGQVHKMFNRLSGYVIPKARGGEEAFNLIATKMIRSPATAEADLTMEINRLKALGEKGIPGERTLRARNIENLQALRDTGVVSDPRIWKAVEEFRPHESARQKALVEHNLLTQEQADAAPYMTYFTRHMGGKIVDDGKGGINWILPKGNKVVGALGEKVGVSLKLEEIKKYMAQDRVQGDPIHIAARPVDASNEGDVSIGAYANEIHSTAELIDKGIADVSSDSVIRQAVRGQRNVDKARFMQHVLSRYGSGKLDGMPFASSTIAKKYYLANEDKYLHEMVPMPVRVATGRLDMMKLDTAPLEDIVKSLDNAIKREGEGKFVLVPKYLKDELKKFVDIENSKDNIFRRLNREFKGSVLPFSPKWHFGNIMDMTLRLFMEGATPVDYLRGRRIMKIIKDHDPQLYNEVLAQIGGGHLSAAARSVTDRGVLPAYKIHQLSAGEFLTRYLMPFKGPNRGAFVGRVYREAQKGSFKISHIIEQTYRTTALGKHSIKMLDGMGENWFRSFYYGGHTMEDMAMALQDTNNLKQLGKYTVDTLGDYTNLSPRMRQAVNTYLPFGLWLRASSKWVATLPYNHPIKTGFFAAVNKTTEDERKQWGLYLDRKAKRVLPSFMLGSIPSGAAPGKDQGWYFRTQQYTSFGPFYDYLDSGLNFVLPQLAGPYDIMRGYDWKGKAIVNKDGSPLTNPQRLGLAIGSLSETMLYPLNMAHRLLVQGTPSNRSAVLAELGPYRNLFNLSKPERDWYRKGDFPGAKVVQDQPDKWTDIVDKWGNPAARVPFGPFGTPKTPGVGPASLLDRARSQSTHDSLLQMPSKKKPKAHKTGSLLG